MSRWRGTTPIRSDRQFRFAATRDELWTQLARIECYRTWWPWLCEFDGVELAAGETWRCRVRPPLRYSVRFTVALGEVEPGQHIAATIDGDIEGTATLSLTDQADGCQIRLVSSLAPQRAALRTFAVLARPVIRSGHDWILDNGARQFARSVGGVQDGGVAGR